MVALSSLSKFIVKGSKANELNNIMRNKLMYEYVGSGKFNVRNGIGIFDVKGTSNFGTTKFRKFFGLDDNGNLVLLKEKAIYNCKPNQYDSRNLSAKWDAYNTLGITTSRNTTSVNGKVTEFKKWSAHDGGNSADLFYRLGFGSTGVIKNNNTFSSVRYIKDDLAQRGSAFQGQIPLNAGLTKVKGFFNPNLGAGYVSGLPGETKGKIVSKEQYEAILERAKDLVHGFAVPKEFPV